MHFLINISSISVSCMGSSPTTRAVALAMVNSPQSQPQIDLTIYKMEFDGRLAECGGVMQFGF